MKNIKVGDIEYFTLLDLQDKLRYVNYNRLGLENLDKLRFEVEMKIRTINAEYKPNPEIDNI